jgi:tetratricopeptide (TPR) repeat protein
MPLVEFRRRSDGNSVLAVNEQFMQASSMRHGSYTFDQAIALYRKGRLGSARAALTSLLEQQPRHAAAWAALGFVERDIGDVAAAAVAFDEALQLNASDPIALSGRARIALERAEGGALQRYQAALSLLPDEPRLLLELAEARVERGDASGIEDFARQLDRLPHWTEGQLALARMRWESLGDEDFDGGVRRLLRETPESLDLWLGFIDLLSSLDRFGPAADAARDARQVVGDRAELLLREAVNAGRAGDVGRSGQIFARLPVDDPVVAVERALHEIRAGELERARASVDAALEKDPASISAWGVAELVYRALDDPRAGWLSGQEGLVRTLCLALDVEVLDRLKTLLRSLHETGVQAAGQSVRGGTQTRWRLFDRPEAELAALKQAIDSAVAGYVAGLPPADERHPLLRHRDAALRVTGSWSVRLTGSGRHVSHTHPLGLIGSACYFVVPDGPGGQLELGRPPPDLKLDLEPMHVITPKRGLLALFPSYLHHGTTRFGAGERLSVAFDVALDPAAF